MSDLLQPGDWVQVWAQVRVPEEGDRGTHPEDIMITLFSHSEQYTADVVRNRVVKPEGLPDFVPICTALNEVRVALTGLEPGQADPLEDGDLILLRCVKHDGHGGKHRHRGMKWPDHLTHGYIEEAH